MYEQTGISTGVDDWESMKRNGHKGYPFQKKNNNNNFENRNKKSTTFGEMDPTNSHQNCAPRRGRKGWYNFGKVPKFTLNHFLCLSERGRLSINLVKKNIMEEEKIGRENIRRIEYKLGRIRSNDIPANRRVKRNTAH